jgi:hypothetical protein
LTQFYILINFNDALNKKRPKGLAGMELLEEQSTNSKTSIGVLILVTIGVGIGSGLIGMSLALLLHYLQHIAYGYSSLHIISPESFLEGVSASSPTRRLFVLGACGLVAGGGWLMIQRFGKPLVSIAQSIKTGKIMPPLTTTCHALVQIITIALGSPLGLLQYLLLGFLIKPAFLWMKRKLCLLVAQAQVWRQSIICL